MSVINSKNPLLLFSIFHSVRWVNLKHLKKFCHFLLRTAFLNRAGSWKSFFSEFYLVLNWPEENLVCYLAENAEPCCVRVLLEIGYGPPHHLCVGPVCVYTVNFESIPKHTIACTQARNVCECTVNFEYILKHTHRSPSRSETRLSSERDWSSAAVRLSETMKRESSLPELRTLTNFLRASKKSSGPVV